MESQLGFYKQVVKNLLSQYEEQKTEWTEVELVFDDQRMSYLVMQVGWHKEERYHNCLVHIDIRNGKIVIQENNTEDLLDEKLIDMGIPADKIYLGLLPPKAHTFLRKSTTQLTQHRELEPA
ncbi:MAG: XisI protein [Caldilineaceae bacterium]